MKTAGFLSPQLTDNLQEIAEFKTTAVRDYQTMNLETIKHAMDKKLVEFTRFIDEMKKQN
ncbi:HepT-like ribonuclease domain-containing protein [Marinomonas dokdonensis]|uniref:HepT-like ribonuclease domain-containing protein n=1 Tax=Marinomonas dokdonensis TaxID=328224 RepID=UPI0040553F30